MHAFDGIGYSYSRLQRYTLHRTRGSHRNYIIICQLTVSLSSLRLFSLRALFVASSIV